MVHIKAIVGSLLAVLACTTLLASILSHHAASVLVNSWSDVDERGLERLSMLSTNPQPLQNFEDDCGSGGSHRLCELGVNIGDVNQANHGDAVLPADNLEESYNLFGISPERETAGNTIGGDWFGHASDAPITQAEVQAQRSVPVSLAQRRNSDIRGRILRVRNGQMLATPLQSLPTECQGETEHQRRLCELGVNVGEPSLGAQGDAFLTSDGIESSYNLAGISPERETAGNTIGGDWFGHVSGAPVTRDEVRAT